MFDPLGFANLLFTLGGAAKDCSHDFNICDCGCIAGTTVTVTYSGGSLSHYCEKVPEY
jgi:hypothetical protein